MENKVDVGDLTTRKNTHHEFGSATEHEWVYLRKNGVVRAYRFSQAGLDIAAEAAKNNKNEAPHLRLRWFPKWW